MNVWIVEQVLGVVDCVVCFDDCYVCMWVVLFQVICGVDVGQVGVDDQYVEVVVVVVVVVGVGGGWCIVLVGCC